MLRYYAMGRKGIILSIAVNLIFAFGAAVLIVGYFKNLEIQKAVDNGIIVEAEIVAVVHQANLKGGGSTHSLLYRYIGDDGIIYEGYCAHGDYRTLKSDEARIGEKVEIYIGIGVDGTGVSWPVSKGKEIKAYESLIFASVFIFLIVAYIVGLLIYLLWYYDKLPKRGKSRAD
ncbi:MAG: hypothetical protein LBL66_05490 [Clostridiales bacterium]|nr:hypothetical protein [Clostridiales bacterium]